MLEIMMIRCYDFCMKMIRFKFIPRLYCVSLQATKTCINWMPESDGLALSLQTVNIREIANDEHERNECFKYFNCV